ncbi:MAG: hypothetical protein AAB855_02850, partial [Patescibacteria group bacterium]
GLGITNSDLEKIAVSTQPNATSTAFTRRLAGSILLQVEEKGEAWYVHPVNLKRYFLGRPADAFRVMRELGLGISNADLRMIAVTPAYRDPDQSLVGKDGQSVFFNEQAGVSISYTSGWEAAPLDELNDDNADRTFQVYAKKGQWFANMTLYRYEDDEPKTSAATQTQDLIDESKQTKNFVQLVPLTINKAAVQGFLGYEPLENGKEKVLRAYIPGDRAYYELVYSIVAAQDATISPVSRETYALFDSMLPTVSRIVESIRFSEPVVEPTNIYKDSDRGIMLRYPEQWPRDYSKDDEEDAAGRFTVTTFNSPTGYLTLLDAGRPFSTFDDYYEGIIAQYKSTEKFTVFSSGPLTHATGQAYSIEYSVRLEDTGTTAYFYEALFEDTADELDFLGSRVYHIIYVAPSAGYYKYLNQAKRSIQSFRTGDAPYELDDVYYDSKSSTQFRHPSEWEVRQAPSGFGFAFGSVQRTITFDYSGGFEPVGTPTTLEQYTLDSVSRFTALGYTDIKISPTTLGGISATRVSAIEPPSELTSTWRIVSVLTLKDGTAFYLNFHAPDEAVQKRYLPLFEQIVSSFQFTK